MVSGYRYGHYFGVAGGHAVLENLVFVHWPLMDPRQPEYVLQPVTLNLPDVKTTFCLLDVVFVTSQYNFVQYLKFFRQTSNVTVYTVSCTRQFAAAAQGCPQI